MKYNELSREEQKKVATYFSTWLKDYTHEVIVRVMEKADEIISDPFAMELLKELHERSEKESKEFADSIGYLLSDFDTFKQYDPHNAPLTHSSAYRHILHDRYINRSEA